MRKLWLFTFYFLMFAMVAFVAPFLVLFYQDLGFSGPQIGLLTGITPLVLFFCTPLWTGLADRTGRHRLLMSLAILGSVVTLIIYPMLHVFWLVLLVAVAFYFFLAPVTPFVDSATMFMLADKKEMYSRIRLGGTVGFGLAALLVGRLVQSYGLKIAFWGGAALFFLAFIVSQKLAHDQLGAANLTGGRVRTLLANSRWLIFLTLAFAGGLSVAVVNNYLLPHMKDLGATESMMGVALMLGTVAEVPILFFGNRLIKRLQSYRLLMIAMVITGLRLLLLGAAGTPGQILIVQLLNGLTFAVMWVAGVAYADERAPAGMSATAQGLFSAMVLGIGTAVGGFIGGLLFDSLGGRSLYLTFGATVLLIVTLAGLVHWRLPAEQQPALPVMLD